MSFTYVPDMTVSQNLLHITVFSNICQIIHTLSDGIAMSDP